MTALFVSRLPLLAALCAAVGVLAWMAVSEIKREIQRGTGRDARREKPARRP